MLFTTGIDVYLLPKQNAGDLSIVRALSEGVRKSDQLRCNCIGLVAVMLRLVRSIDGNADVVCLILGEDGEFDTDLGKV